MKKLKKIEAYTPAWERLANAEARAFAPEIYPCAKCGGPVVTGYCCGRCGDDNPESPESRSKSSANLNGKGDRR